MPEARDRLSRPVDLAEAYSQRLAGNRRIYIDPEPQNIIVLAGSQPVRQRTPTGLGFGDTGLGGGGGLARSTLRTPRTRYGNGRISFPLSTPDRENTPVGSSRRRRGRASNSKLPSWYPRTPLQDTTAIARDIARRRARLRLVESDGENTEGQVPRDHGVSVTPYTVVWTKRCLPASVGKLQKIIRDVSNQPSEGEFLTPQKKLLNSIDLVEKVVREELERLKKTPSAKKAERVQKVRTLMSMR